MIDDFDPTGEAGFQLAMGGSLSVVLAMTVLEDHRDYIEHMELLLDKAEKGNVPELYFKVEDIDSFRAYLRESFLVSIVAYLEDLCRGACDDLAVLLPIRIRAEDLSGRSAIERTRNYFRKVVGEEVPSDTLWNRLDLYRKARNVIAHRGHLRVDEADTKIRAKIQSLSGVGVDEYRSVSTSLRHSWTAFSEPRSAAPAL
jgi:hypothetical protein